MRFMFIVVLTIVINACAASTLFDQTKTSVDLFDKILIVMKGRTTSDRYQQFGNSYELKEEAGQRIDKLTLFYWKDFDNYVALKERFKGFRWQEKRLENSLKEDAPSENYLVELPEIGMEFQYDNNAPYRKVMWIYFE